MAGFARLKWTNNTCMTLALRSASEKMIATTQASLDVRTAGIKTSRRRGFLPSFNTHFFGVSPNFEDPKIMSAPAGIFSKEDVEALHVFVRETAPVIQNANASLHVPNPKCKAMMSISKGRVQKSHGSASASLLPHTLLGCFYQKMNTQKLCLRRQGLFQNNTPDTPCLCSRDDAFYLKTLGKLAMFQKPPLNVPHEHVESGGYKSPTSIPLLLSSNTHPSGCFTKTSRRRCHVCAGEGFPKPLCCPPCVPLRSDGLYEER